MRHEFLSCGFVGFPGALGAGVVDLRDWHASGRSFLEGFESWNIDRKERYALGREDGPQLRAVRLWWWWDFRQKHAVAIAANIIERLERQDEPVGIKTRGHGGNDEEVTSF